MSSSKPNILKLSQKYPSLKKIYLYYNIYIRNFKFFFNNSQFGEDKKIIKIFNEKRNGTYLDLGCFHPIRQNNTYLMHKRGWKGLNIDLNPLSIEFWLGDQYRIHERLKYIKVSDKWKKEILYP